MKNIIITFLIIFIIFGTIYFAELQCKNTCDVIDIHSKSVSESDNTKIKLKDGWFVTGYEVDYDNGQVILSIGEE